MLSSTFSFKLRSLSGLFLALATILAIEGTSCLLRTDMQPFRSNLVTMSYLHQDNYAKFATEIKLLNAAHLKPRFIQVGDSSGYHGPIPKEIMQHIGDDNPYVILNCCADMGYRGHRLIAQYALEHMPSIKYLVYYVTPFAPSAKFANVNGALADSIQASLLDSWNALMPPSLAFRIYAVNSLFYGTFTRELEGNPLNSTLSSDQSFIRTYADQFLENYGWWPRPIDMKALPYASIGPCDMHVHFEDSGNGELKSKDMLEELNKTAELARSRHVKMILVYNPVSCSDSNNPEILDLKQRLSVFRQQNPDVWVPFPFIHTLPITDFVDSFHTNIEGSQIVSEQLGEYLASQLTKSSAY